MAITFFGIATNPTDNAGGTTPVTITAPASMQVGDLCIACAVERLASITITNTTTGGQTWTSLPIQNIVNASTRIFYCTYNGTWSTDPVFTGSSTSEMSVQMLVFRPTSIYYGWNVDVAQTQSRFQTNSAEKLFSSVDTVANDTVSLAVVLTTDSLATYTLSTVNSWLQTGLSAQYRNSVGNKISNAYAYKILTAAGATSSVGLTPSGINTGSMNRLTFAESFTLPVLTTTAVSSITSMTATSGGNITASNGTILERGVVWGTATNPTTANSKVTALVDSNFSTTITGLLANTTYHIRAYAINSIGISYGADVQFTTSNVGISITL